MTKPPSVKVQKSQGRFVFSAKTWLYQLFYPFYFIYHPSTCKSDARHTCALLKSFAGLWRTSNKYKLCPTKIDWSLTLGLIRMEVLEHTVMGPGKTQKLIFFFFFSFFSFSNRRDGRRGERGRGEEREGGGGWKGAKGQKRLRGGQKGCRWSETVMCDVTKKKQKPWLCLFLGLYVRQKKLQGFNSC